jgi:hypothetical protein
VGTNFAMYVLVCLAVSVANVLNNIYANQSFFVRIDDLNGYINYLLY